MQNDHLFRRRPDRFRLPIVRSVMGRAMWAVAGVAAATLVRAALDPVVHEQIPYLAYVAALIVVTWFGGRPAGIANMIAAAFTANYFFTEPRYEFVPHGQDWVAMSVFAAIGSGLIWVVARWKAAEIVLHEQLAELHTIFETVPAAIFVTRDPGAARMDGNRLAAEYLRVPPGANLSKTGPAEERPATFRVMRDGRELEGDELPVQMAIARGVEVRDYDFDIAYEDGTTRPLFGNVAPLRDERGQIRGSVGAFIDVTELRRLQSELREANRIKDDFLATLSHELRTPLSAIIGWSDMLRRKKLPPEAAAQALESIYRNAQAQTQMVNDVLDVSRIVSGRTRIEMRPLDPVVVLANALDSVRPTAQAKGVRLATDFDAVLAPVLGDAGRLQQIFWNLLTNAVKFTPAGGEIRVVLRHAEQHLYVTVEDTGIGISADFLPHVFERFRQHDSSSSRRHSGLGLGLAIVRHLVELHGGTVTADSPGEGLGATFTVIIPAAPTAERRQGETSGTRQVPAVTASDDDLPSVCGTRVLVVDDAAEARELAAAVLRHHGAVVKVAGTAAEGLRQFEAFEPDVLLLDLAMPDEDGYALIRRIRSSGDRGRQIPAIALTAYAREEDKRRAVLAGFDVHLAKPVESNTLVRAVSRVRPHDLHA